MRNPIIFLLLCLGCVQAVALTPGEEQIRQISEQLQENPHALVAGIPIAPVRVLTDFYARRGFRPVWNDNGRFGALLSVLRGADRHGLDPRDYHYRRLAGWPANNDARQEAQRDILATDGLIRFAYHLYYGKVDPTTLQPDWNLTRRLRGRDPVAVIEEAVNARSLAGYLDTQLAPNGTFYTGLMRALARLREVAAAGGWPPVPGGPSLRPGEQSPRVPALRARMVVTDPKMAPAADEPERYDSSLVAAVERFQRRHGLLPDGIVGRRTLRALNVSAQARVDQVRVNLERTRWLFRKLGARYLIVNIAGFHAYLMEDGKRVWYSRVVVGTPYRKTPVFKSTMTYLVLNPAWTVPPTVLKEDIIPAIHRDPGYLARANMVLLDAEGRQVNPDDIDLKTLTVNNFPYTVRQEPGPQNVLGRIKFMFPNGHFVYLHDTPSRGLFWRADRTFSSGCIRVQHPLTLAELLLDDPVNWSRARIEERIAEGTTQTVNLKSPVPVFLVYWTAEPEADGVVKLFNDVYDRDPAVLTALQQPFSAVERR